MPRCQRTFLRLRTNLDKREDASSHDEIWRCPHCPDAEIYETVTDPDLCAYARFAEAECIRDFGKPSDRQRPYALIFGVRPECVLEQTDRRYDIYLKRDSDWYQLRQQIGHEMFHRVCSEGRTFHWTHEMFACLTSVSLLRRSGLGEYADKVDTWYRNSATSLSITEAMKVDLVAGEIGPAGGLPDAFYGRVSVTGTELAAVVGDRILRILARKRHRDGSPDVNGWLLTLSPTQKHKCAQIMGITVGTHK